MEQKRRKKGRKMTGWHAFGHHTEIHQIRRVSLSVCVSNLDQSTEHQGSSLASSWVIGAVSISSSSSFHKSFQMRKRRRRKQHLGMSDDQKKRSFFSPSPFSYPSHLIVTRTSTALGCVRTEERRVTGVFVMGGRRLVE